MSEESTSSSLPQGPGALIEAARRKQGLHIAALAAQLKVSTARLEALEREQWSALPDATNARALATAVCRALGMDPAPVLAGMPRASGAELDRVSVGLNEPVRSRHGAALPLWALVLVVLALIGAGALLLWPKSAPEAAVEAPPELAQGAVSEAAPLPGLAAASQPASSASELTTPTITTPALPTTAPAVSPALVASAPPQAQPQPQPVLPGAATLEIRAASGESWVSVVDASGSTLASRLLLQGESLSLQPQAPVRLVLGNAPALNLSWRGQAQAFDGYEQRRVARLELK